MAKDSASAEVMSAAEIKPLLQAAKHAPVACAIGLTREKGGVILLHRRTKPRKLLAELLRQGKGSGLDLDRASLRFGRASVDGGSDSTTVAFTVNKAPSGPLHVKMVESCAPPVSRAAPSPSTPRWKMRATRTSRKRRRTPQPHGRRPAMPRPHPRHQPTPQH